MSYLAGTMDTTIAFLPFRNLSGDQKIDLLREGFREDLVIQLSKFKGLSILSPESTRQAMAPSELLELGVDYLVTGSCRIVGDQFRIGVQLTRAQDSRIAFAHEYVESLETIFDIQDDIIRQLVNVLQQQIDSDLLSYSFKKPKVQLAVYENFLRGMDALRKGGIEHDQEARTHFNAALTIDPTYARAYTGLSLSHFNEWSCLLWDRWDVAKTGAQEFALRALEYDENDHVALAVAGRTFLFSEEYDRAEHYLRKSIQIHPNDADNLVQIAFSFMFLGELEEAVQLCEKAFALNPLHRDWYYGYSSNIYFEFGKDAKAVELGSRLNFENYWVDFPFYLAAAHYHLGEERQMWLQWERFLQLYRQHVADSRKMDAQSAVEWNININPYKKGTRLDAFRRFILEERLSAMIPPSVNRTETACFVQKGDLWEMHFRGATARVKDAKGYHDIRRLLRQMGAEIHCTELMGAEVASEKGIELLDRQAKQQYRQRLQELQHDIQEAEELGQLERKASLQEEYDQLLDHLSSATGLHGKTRVSNTAVDKVRSAVTMRIRSSIKKIEPVHPSLAKHLAASIKTGLFCAYQPEVAVEWEV